MAVEHNGSITLVAGEALEPYRRVKYHTTGGQVVYADAADGDNWLGIAQPNTEGDSVASGDHVPVVMRGGNVTLKVTCGAAVTANADLYPEDDGKVSDDVGTVVIGKAAGDGTGAADDSVIAMHPISESRPLVEPMTQTAATDTVTLTVAQLLTKVIDGTPTAAANYTLPTAALLVAGIANCKVGDSFFFVVNNKSAGANTITMVAGGATLDGLVTITQNVVRVYLVIVTNVTAASEAYSVYGTGT